MDNQNKGMVYVRFLPYADTLKQLTYDLIRVRLCSNNPLSGKVNSGNELLIINTHDRLANSCLFVCYEFRVFTKDVKRAGQMSQGNADTSKIAASEFSSLYKELFEVSDRCTYIFKDDQGNNEFVLVDINAVGAANENARHDELIGRPFNKTRLGKAGKGLLDALGGVNRSGISDKFSGLFQHDKQDISWREYSILKLSGTDHVAVICNPRRELLQILNSIYGFVGIYSPDGTLIEANDAPLMAAGLTRDQVLGKPFWETYWWSHSKDARKRIRHLLECAAKGETVREDVSVRVAEDVFIVIDVTFAPLPDKEGKITRLVGFGVDISDRISAVEQALQKTKELRISEERYELAVAGSNDGLWDWEVQTVKTYLSPRWKEILGYADHELPNVYDSFGKALHPEERDTVENAVKAHLEERTPFDQEFRLRHKDAHYVWVRAKGQAIWNDDGQPLRMAGSISDISKRKQAELELVSSEVRMEEILYIAAEAVIIAGSDMKIQVFNRGAERIFGYSREEIIGCHIELLLPQSSRKRHRKLVENFDQTGQEFILMDSRAEISGRKHDGTLFPAAASVSKAIVQDQTIFTVVLRDITEAKKYQDALVLAKEQAERASNSKSEFLAAMSHDLRTPLNAILGFSEMIRQQYNGPIDGKYIEYADDIAGSGKLLLSLVNDILDISALEAGKMKITRERFDIHDLVTECEMIMLSRVQSDGVNMEILRAAGPLEVFADRRAVMQILLNLLSNAIKFTPKSGEVKLITAESPDAIILSVVDTGEGMTKSEMDVVMEPFSQGSNNNPYLLKDGWGLGLSIVRSLVDLHGGELRLESEPNKGTTVTVVLPKH
jgi:PAS domain S-box-containing protein